MVQTWGNHGPTQAPTPAQDAQGQEPTMESVEAATEGAEDLGMLDDVG